MKFYFLVLLPFFFNLCWSITPNKKNKLISIMIDPMGDAKNTGRIIEDTFERGLTLSFAQELKKELEKNHQQVRIILTRFAGESIEPLQNASFANNLEIELFITISFFWQQEGTSSVYLYHQQYNPITDAWNIKPRRREFLPPHTAYLINLNKSSLYTTMLHNELIKIAPSYKYSAQGVWAAPLTPLIGIVAPSFCIEIGLKTKDDWKRFLEPMAIGLNALILDLKEGKNF